jgi:Flp pilus assembly protein TadD
MNIRIVFIFLLAIVIGLSGLNTPVYAAGSSDDEPSKSEADFTSGKSALKAGNYKLAIRNFQRVINSTPNNADALNYLGYSYRKMGNFKDSLSYYKKALAINPGHRGAREYLGELYLQKGDLKSAKAQLAKLDSLCTFGCEEFDDLKNAIATFEKKK